MESCLRISELSPCLVCRRLSEVKRTVSDLEVQTILRSFREPERHVIQLVHSVLSRLAGIPRMDFDRLPPSDFPTILSPIA